MADLIAVVFPSEEKAEEVRDKIFGDAEGLPDRHRRRGDRDEDRERAR